MSEIHQATPSLRARALASVAAVAIVASGALGVTVVQSQHPAFAESAPITANPATSAGPAAARAG